MTKYVVGADGAPEGDGHRCLPEDTGSPGSSLEVKRTPAFDGPPLVPLEDS